MTSGNLLGRLGVWVSRGSLTPGQAGELAALAEDLGYGAFWISGGAAPGTFEYARPLELMAGYLDALDSAPDPLPPGRRLLGALGPKMLQLAAQRSLGAHPYLVTPGYTGQARAQLGPALLAPEQTILVDADPARARATARQFLARYRRGWERPPGRLAGRVG
jgi:alkanesulfonate monooxygenase SsuD/methylene tetrahydromethanopterin reductase-like flavin-dependent oxidoreductase (luciferase family)